MQQSQLSLDLRQLFTGNTQGDTALYLSAYGFPLSVDAYICVYLEGVINVTLS